MTTPSNEPNKKQDEGGLKDKFKQSVESFKKNERVEEIYNYASNNQRDTIAYVVLLVGLILMLFGSPYFGATLVGVIFGLYFSIEIATFFKNYKEYVDRFGQVRSIILGGSLLALLIACPFFFIGAAVAVALREFIRAEKG